MESASGAMQKIDTMFFKKNESRTIRAETLFTNFIVEHNLPLSVADHAAGPLFKKMFPVKLPNSMAVLVLKQQPSFMHQKMQKSNSWEIYAYPVWCTLMLKEPFYIL